MSVERQNKNSFSFNIRVLDNNNNYKKLKDIFIRKQDIYLIKLLEKKAKNNKNEKIDKTLKKITSYDKEKIYQNFKTYKSPIINNNINKHEYKNIRIIKKKLDNSVNEKNYILENIIDESKNNKITYNFDNLITSKIYNSDISRNNQTMLNVKTENTNIYDESNNHNILNTIYESKKNILKAKYNKTTTNLFNQKHTPNIVLPKNIKNNGIENQKKLDKKNKLFLNNDDNDINMDKHLYNKINLTDNKNGKNIYNIKKCLKLNNKAVQFHKVFNLFKNDKYIKDKRQKIIIKNNFVENENSERNTNHIKINHSLNKYDNIKPVENFNNGLPYINSRPNVN